MRDCFHFAPRNDLSKLTWQTIRLLIVIGGGEVGSSLASLLRAGNHSVKIVEIRPDEIPRLQQTGAPESVICGNGTDPAVLEAAGIRQANVVAAVTGKDETNLVVTSLARFECNVPRTIARVHRPTHAWMFTPAMGVDVALNQADLLAHLLGDEMSLGDMMTLLKLRKGQYALVEERVAPTATAAGHAIRELELPTECALAAVIRGGQLLVPRPDLVLQPADEVLAVVHSSQAKQLAELLGQAQ